MAKRYLSPVDSELIRLRLLEEKDLELTRSWRNQEHIRRWFFNQDLITPDQQQNWYAGYKDRDDDFIFIIEDKSLQNDPVGQISIYHIDWASLRGEYGRLMIGDPRGHGKGLAKEATRLVLQLASNVLRLQEIYLEVFADNQSAISVYQACQFKVVGQKENIVTMSYRAG